jgi:sugar transferase EpsL
MLKRIFDIVCAGFLLLLLSPLFLALALLIRLKMGSPVFFTQRRPGKNEEPFTMYKFRTMTNQKDEKGTLLPAEERLTSFGKFLRSTSLDELPELLNVVKGDMSLVGPRPLRMEYLPLYNKFQRKRHAIRPGITGWAQINGRNKISWEHKFNLDVWYVKNRSFWLDLKILVRTVIKAVKKEDINYSKDQPMKPFKGADLNG